MNIEETMQQLTEHHMRCLALLVKLEWSGRWYPEGSTMGSVDYEDAREACPICRGLKAQYYPSVPFGHKPGCEIAEVLKG
jgi:hypothetical protein